MFWDAVPVYLDPSAGSILVSIEDLVDLRMRKEAQKMQKGGLLSQPLPGHVRCKPSGDAMGATRRDKNRLALVLRQKIEGLFDLPPGQLPVGSHLPSILIVQCSQPCFLDDMSKGEEPSVWLRSFNVVLNGRQIERKEGERVGALMSGWRQVRRDFPELFDAGVLVAGFLPLLPFLIFLKIIKS